VNQISQLIAVAGVALAQSSFASSVGSASVGTWLEASGSGGSIDASSQADANLDSRRLSFAIQSIKEVNSAGVSVEGAASVTHSVSGFLDMGFNVGPVSTGSNLTFSGQVSANASASVAVSSPSIPLTTAKVSVEGVYMYQNAEAIVGSGSAEAFVSVRFSGVGAERNAMLASFSFPS